jgi:L-fuconolactonase
VIIDAHLHTWNTAEIPIGWTAAAGLPDRAPIPEESAQRRYVLVEADADDRHRETEWLLALARRDARVHGVVAAAALDGSDAARELDHLAGFPEIVGVRRLLQDGDPFEPPGLAEGLGHLAERGLPFDACVRASELQALHRLLSRAPGPVVVLDHMGKPPVQDAAAMRRWRADLADLAELPGLYCKLSGLAAECRDASELDACTDDVVGHALAVFGAERCLVGSDRPVSQSPWDWCERVLRLVPDAQRERVAHENAAAIYRRAR